MKANFLISGMNMYWKCKVICSRQKRATLVKRCSAIHGLNNFTLLRKTHSASSSVLNCGKECRLRCGWRELEARGHELVLTLHMTKGLGTQPGEQRKRCHREKSERQGACLSNLYHLRLKGCKGSGFYPLIL